MSQRFGFQPGSFVPLLSTIRDILFKHGLIAQGTVAADLVDLAHLESPEFARRLQGGEVWGSAGSIADEAGLRPSFDPVGLRRNGTLWF
jgi:hypothetical protein